jgi:SAM-dependent methyltransferase
MMSDADTTVVEGGEPTMRAVSCTLCGSDAVCWSRQIRDHARIDSSYTLVKCASCGLVYLNPRPDYEEILARSPAYQSMMDEMLEKLRASWVGRLGLRLMRDARTRTTPGGRLLDIGCARGDFALRMSTLGWEAHGIELDGEAAQFASEVRGLRVLQGRAEDRLPEYGRESFDLVTMWHVLEHVEDPSRVLAEVHRVLRPGGRVVVEVPNYDSLISAMLGKYWYSLEPPFHLTHFTPATLRRMLEIRDFRSVQLRGEPEPGQTIWSLHMLWLGLQGRPWDGHLIWNPVAAVAFYPFEFLLARIGRANHMGATAWKV